MSEVSTGRSLTRQEKVVFSPYHLNHILIHCIKDDTNAYLSIEPEPHNVVWDPSYSWERDFNAHQCNTNGLSTLFTSKSDNIIDKGAYRW